MNITKTEIDKLPLPAKGEKLYRDDRLRGFGVRVTARGSKTFFVERDIKAKTIRISIAPTNVISVDAARKQATALLAQMHEGIDPRETAKANKAYSVTLREIMQNYLAHKQTRNGPLKDRTKKDIAYHMENSFAAWIDRPAKDITREVCLTRFRALTEGGLRGNRTAPSQANQAFIVLRALINHAREMHAVENADGEVDYPLFAVNPVSRMFKLQKPNPEKARTGNVPADKIGAVWAMLTGAIDSHMGVNWHGWGSSAANDIVGFLILTGARWSEAAKLTWDQVDFDGDVPTWSLTSLQAKNHNAVTFPISDAVRDLLKARLALRPKKNPYVFWATNREGGHITDARATLKRVAEIAELHITPHDLRRTFTMLAEQCGVEMHKIELLTNHVPKSVTQRHYMDTSNLRRFAPEVQTIAGHVIGKCNLAIAVHSGGKRHRDSRIINQSVILTEEVHVRPG